MRKGLSVLVFCMLAAPAAFADEIAADSRLKAVTVYADRAMLTRQAVVDVPAGAHTIVFKGLPVGLLPDSLRAEGMSAADVKFGAVANKVVVDSELVSQREKDLNDSLISLQDKRNALLAEKQALSAKQTFLDSLSKVGSLRSQEDIAEINLKPDTWAAAAGAIYTGISDILKGQQTQDVAIRELDKQIQKVQQEIAQLYTGQRSTYQVSLPVEASAAAKLTVELSYQLPDATWSPLYDARLDTKEGTLDLTQYGAVSQNSGEDWTDVELTLSTAQPQRGTGLPDLDPMWVSLGYPQPVMAYGKADGSFSNIAGAPVAMRMATQEMAMDSALPAAAPLAEKKAAFATAVIETGGFVSEYKIPGPSTVKSDGTQTKLMIGNFDTDNEIRIQVKPQLSTEAYLVAHTKLKGEAPVLAGPVSLFRDGAFVGQAGLPLLRPGQESDLAFGVDDQVSVKRRVLKDERGEAGVLTKDSVLERNFVTELQNLHKKQIEVVLLETIPASQNEQVGVQIVDAATTPGYKQDVKNIKGLLRWSVPLQPQQKSEVRLGWKVNWPKGQNLSGL